MSVSLKARFKHWLHTSCPGFAGSFGYYGAKAYFPSDSFVFRLACEQGIYEAANLRVLLSALRPDTLAFDVGANIGLMSIPLLASESSLRVVSIEASPQNHRCLTRTVQESPWRDRWEIVACAASDRAGEAEFHCAAPALGAFDSFVDTGRAGNMNKIRVPLVTLDSLWSERGRPPVCAIKIDVEGAELSVLRGAAECLRATRPLVLIEWNDANLRGFDVPPSSLLAFAEEFGFEVFALPAVARVHSAAQLQVLMQFGENFVLLPAGGAC